MAELALKPTRQLYRFDQMAVNVNERVEPGDTDLAHYVGLEHLDTDSLKIRRWGTPEDVEATKLRFRKGDIIFGRRRVYQRKLAVAEFDGICSAHAMVLRANPAVVLPEFLPFFMQSDLFMNRALEISVGSLSPTINWRTLAAQEFPLPPPEEQRRLVEVLSVCDELAESYSHCIESAQRAASSFTDSVFGVLRNKDVSGKSDSSSELNLIPFSRYARVQVGYPFQSSEYGDSGDRLLRCSNVGVKKIDWTPDITKYWPTERRGEYAEYVLRPNDIVIALDRPFVGSGFKIARLTSDDLPALLLQRVGRFVLEAGVNPDYVWCFLNSQLFKSHLLSKQKGTDLPHISRFDIESAHLPYVLPERQVEIGAIYRSLELASANANIRRRDISQLKTVLLQHLT